ncbi:MAG: histidine phosphatase family protein [Caldilineaceae bacterium]|nr:histidine phosphatase family protein [Caldilineaceae bacterium]
MTTLYLITHAHTQQQPNVDAATWRLSETGRTQARILAQQPFWEYVDRVVLSSEPKTRLTVEAVLGTHPRPVIVDARFDELIRTAEWTHDYAGRVAEVFAHPNVSIEGWEAAQHALTRFLAGIETVRQQYTGETLALVGHGLTLSLYRAHLLGQARVDLEEWRTLSFAAVAQVDLQSQELIADFVPVAGASPRG